MSLKTLVALRRMDAANLLPVSLGVRITLKKT